MHLTETGRDLSNF